MDATLVSAWTSLCQQLAPAFTAPTLATFLQLVTGWTMCRGRALVTHFIGAIGPSALLGHPAKHWTTYEKFFHRAAWEPDDVTRLLLQRVVEPLLAAQDGDDGWLDLLIDDTTAGRCGDHVALAGYFKDASVSNAKGKVVHWSHNWVVGVVAVGLTRWRGWVCGLPVLAALYRKPADCDDDHPFRTRQQLAARMIRQAHAALPGRRIRVKADGQYATKEVAGACVEVGGVLISRLRGDAALFALPPRRKPAGRCGPAKRRGRRLSTPKAMAKRKAGWRTLYVTLHGKRVRRRVKSRVCLWWHVCKAHPVKVVIVRNPTGRGRDDYLLSTDPAMDDRDVIGHYAGRWPVEEVIHDAKQHDGLEQTAGWCERTVLRQAPIALVKQTLVKAWYVRCADELERRPTATTTTTRPWQPPKSHPSYRDMLGALRRALWQTRVKPLNSALRGRVGDALRSLMFTLCDAA